MGGGENGGVGEEGDPRARGDGRWTRRRHRGRERGGGGKEKRGLCLVVPAAARGRKEVHTVEFEVKGDMPAGKGERR